ncbi:MAG TPA: DUF4331 domain-containing protein [Actinomycetota bacterium]
MHPVRHRSRLAALAAVTATALGLGATALGPVGGGASSHREAPLVAADPQVDVTDVYAFVSPDDPTTVTLISNWIPFEEPAGGPNFYSFAPGVQYDIRVDNDHDAKPDLIYRWLFANHYRTKATFLYNTGQVTSLTDGDLNFYQTYDLQLIKPEKKHNNTTTLFNDVIAAPSHVGDASMPDYEALRDEAIHTSGATKTFAGQADEGFFLDLRVFDLLYGGALEGDGTFAEDGDDTTDGFNVHTMALQVPKAALAAGGDAEANPIIGIWSTAQRRSTRILKANGSQKHEGKFVQVSRLGMPLVNEVVIPVGQKDLFNASAPADDGQFASHVTDPELPKLIELIYGIPAPATPRDDLVAVFLTGVEGLNKPDGVVPSEQLRLNMSIPPCEEGCAEHSTLGVIGGDIAGFPNGRRLTDDILDIAVQVVEGELVGSPNDLGDGVDVNDVAFGETFPYLALPHSGSDASPH